MNSMELLIATHAFATLAMTGLIWFVQVVHYPLMARVGAEGFAMFQAGHLRRTTLVVGPLMLVELVTATWLFLALPMSEMGWVATAGLGLLSVVWLSTSLLQVPCHRRLESGLDLSVVRRLVATNWLRTVPWTARAMLALYLLVMVG